MNNVNSNNYKKYATKVTASIFLFFLFFSTIFSSNVFAQNTSSIQGKIKVEAVGFFGHPPMKPTLDAIKEACNKFTDKVDLVIYNEETEEGQKFLSEKGLSGHIPMALYVNGQNTVLVDNKNITFRDFVNQEWRVKDLEKAIELSLKKNDTTSSDTISDGGMNNITIIILAVVIIAVVLITAFIFRRKLFVKKHK